MAISPKIKYAGYEVTITNHVAELFLVWVLGCVSQTSSRNSF